MVDNFQVDLDHWQLDALRSVGGDRLNPRRRLCMKACTGPGKSAALAWIGWHRLTCFGTKEEHPKGAALSGEGRDNLKDNLWSELRKWQERSEFLLRAFEWQQEKIFARDHPGTWFLSARSYPKDANVQAIGRSLSGLHSKFPFILLDETGDMPKGVGQKATQIFTGGPLDALIAQAGNPTSTDGLLYHTCTHEKGITEVITITADPDDPNRTSRVSAEHAREQIELYGRDDPWVMSTILGLFPPSGFSNLLSVEQVEAAMRRTYREVDYVHIQKRLGIDVAREGNDRTVIFPRQGLASFPPTIMRGAEGYEIAAQTAYIRHEVGSEVEYFDDTGGWAGAAIEAYMAAGHSPMRVQFAGKANNPRYYNKRAEMWFRMAEWVKRGGHIPKSCGEIVAELTVPKYTFKNGRFLIEPKEKVKERLGRSPDLADALALTFAAVDCPSTTNAAGQYAQVGAGEATQVLPDWDPFGL